jgi:hypothetical protein
MKIMTFLEPPQGDMIEEIRRACERQIAERPAAG